MIYSTFDILISPIIYWPFALLGIFILLLLVSLITRKIAMTKALSIICIGSFSFWLCVGYYPHPSQIDDAEFYPRFFIKKQPSFQMEFHDIFNGEDVPPLHRLSKTRKIQLQNYCKYRYGIPSNTDSDLLNCMTKMYPNIDHQI